MLPEYVYWIMMCFMALPKAYAGAKKAFNYLKGKFSD